LEIVGGGVRVPKFQQTLLEFTKRSVIDKHLNGDEAAVFGATFFGASQSAAYRSREIKVKDLFPYAVDATVKSISGEGKPIL
jgi:hypoxia up-regulated 1